jgi:hypothetical protein
MKIFAALIALALIAFILFFANGLVGNPVSKFMANNSAKKYVETNYHNRDFKVGSASYNFKSGGYHVAVTSPSSRDTHFSISISMGGKVYNDSYSSVTSGWNTYYRLETEYRKLVDTLFKSPNFPIAGEIDFGSIKIAEVELNGGVGANYGIDMSTLILDHEYDIYDIAKEAGEIVFYAVDDVVTIERASKIILQLRREFDRANIPFYGLDFVLQKPKTTDKPRPADEQIYIQGFLYSDIYEEDMELRVEKAYHELDEYYKQEDSKREEKEKIDL